MYSTENELLDDGVWVIVGVGIGSSLLKQAPFCQGILIMGEGYVGNLCSFLLILL